VPSCSMPSLMFEREPGGPHCCTYVGQLVSSVPLLTMGFTAVTVTSKVDQQLYSCMPVT
jgi:hypothetical protein